MFAWISRAALIVALGARPHGRGAGPAARQGLVRHQLGGAGRARRLLPGARRRHLPEIRARRHHRAGRAEREQPPPAGGRQARLLHERELRCRASTRSSRTCRPRGRRHVPEGPAGVHRAPGPGHREIRGPQEAHAVHLQGGHCHLFPVDEDRLRLQGRSRSNPTPSTRSRSSPTSARPCRAMSPPSPMRSRSRAASSRRCSCSPTRASTPTRP